MLPIALSSEHKMKWLIYVCYHFPKISETFILEELRHLSHCYLLAVVALNNPRENGIETPPYLQQIFYFENTFRTKKGYQHLVQAILWFLIRRPIRLLEAWALLPDCKQWTLYLAGILFAFKYRSISPMHIHATFSAESATMAAIMAKLLNQSYSVTDQAQDYIAKMTGIYAHLKQSSLFFTSCLYTKKQLLKQNPYIPSEKIKIVYSGIDPDRFQPSAELNPDNRYRLITVTRFIDTKGLPDIFHALALIIKDYPFIQYDLIGSGPLQSALYRLAVNLQINDLIHWRNVIPNQQLPDYYRQASIFILPCVITPRLVEDSLPLVIGEAMAAELVVITTPVGGIHELVKHNYNGIIVKPRSPQMIASAIRHIFEETEFYRPIRINARTSVIKYYNSKLEKLKLVGLYRQYEKKLFI